MAATATRAQLLIRRGDLFSALRQLEVDREDGSIDAAAYTAARRRYEEEAAEVLRTLDGIGEESPAAVPTRTGPVRRWMVAGAAVLAIAAIGAGLFGAVRARTNSTPIGVIKLQAAQQSARHHPHSAAALVALGNAYLHRGDAVRADAAYKSAMRAAPGDPAPVVLHAMMMGSSLREGDALSLLTGVEKRHPRYARAWLLDGLLASHLTTGYARAIRAWRRFLQLRPAAPIAPEVRSWITGIKRGLRPPRPATAATGG